MLTLASFLRRISYTSLLTTLTVLLSSQAANAQTAQRQSPVGAVSLEALRQSYLDAALTKQVNKLDSLFEWTGISAEAHAAALKSISEDFDRTIVSATIREALPADTEDYTRANIRFNHPVLKILEVKFAKEKSSAAFFIGRCGIGYCLVNAVMEPAPPS